MESLVTRSSIKAGAALLARSVDFSLPAPHPDMRACVVVPARNEETTLPALIAALADQRDLQGIALHPDSYEVILLLNNCTDRTAAVGAALRAQYPRHHLHLVEISFPPEHAHVGKARQALFDTAFARLLTLDKSNGLILTTDADSRPMPEWIAQTEAEMNDGVAGVGGRICLDPMEVATLPAGVRRFLLLDIGYRRALEELRSLYAPESHDPFPRHHQHFGGSLAVTAAAYGAAGGMPLHRSNEDVALYRAIVDSGGRFRHSYAVRVVTSARMIGRAQGGLADALEWWDEQARGSLPVFVESAAAAEARLAELGLWCAANLGAIPPSYLRLTPDQPLPEKRAEIHATLRELRVICAALRPLPLATRLAAARRRFAELPEMRESAA